LECLAAIFGELLREVVRGNGDHAEVRSELLSGGLRELELTSDEVVALGAEMLVEDDLVHGFGEVNVDLVEESGGVGGGLATETLGVLGHGEDTADLVVVHLRDLVLGHVLDVVVILKESVSLDTLVEGCLEPRGENNGIFLIEQNEDAVEAAFLLGVFPVAVVAFSACSELGHLQLTPVAQAVLVTPESLGVNSVLSGIGAPLLGGL